MVLVDEAGSHVDNECGSSLYHIRRSNKNFKEFYSLMLVAATSGKKVRLEVTPECVGTRAILSHGSVAFR